MPKMGRTAEAGVAKVGAVANGTWVAACSIPIRHWMFVAGVREMNVVDVLEAEIAM